MTDVNIKDLVETYCREHRISLIDGKGMNSQGLEVRYKTKGPLEEINLTKFYSPKENLFDYEFAAASRCPDDRITVVNYISLVNNRFYDRFKSLPENLNGNPYHFFLQEMNRMAEDMIKRRKKGLGINLRHETNASQKELKEILDELIKPIHGLV